MPPKRVSKSLLSVSSFAATLLLSTQAAAIPRFATEVDVGPQHSCVATNCGDAVCWGGTENAYGEDANSANIGAADVAVGFDHSCALDSDGEVVCWGSDSSGQSTPPTGPFQEIDSMGYNTCGLHEDGTAECWGWDAYGQTSNVPAGVQFRQLSTGPYHSCGVTSGRNGLYCWGYVPARPDNPNDPSASNNYRGSDHVLATDVLVYPGEKFQQVAVGAFHTCVRSSYDYVYCWGNNSLQAVSATVNGTPVALEVSSVDPDKADGVYWHSGGGFVDLGAGYDGTCTVQYVAQTQSYHLNCWGWPFYEGGDYTPPATNTEFEPDRVFAGFQHACALDDDTAELRCWGRDDVYYSSPSEPITQIPEMGQCITPLPPIIPTWPSIPSWP